MKQMNDVLAIVEPHFVDYEQFKQRMDKYALEAKRLCGVHEMVKQYADESGIEFVEAMEEPYKVIVFWDNKYEPVRLEMNRWLRKGKRVLLTNTARDYWKE